MKQVGLLLARLLFVALLSAISIFAGGAIFMQRPVGIVFLTLFVSWLLLTVIGRPIGSPSKYNRSQRIVVALGSLALIPIVLAPWEYTHFSGPIPRDGLLSWVGLALFGGGIAFQAAAMLALQGMYTLRLGVGTAHRLVTRGPYWVVRHPGYLSNIVEMFGIALALSSLIALSAAFLVIPLLLQRIKDEDTMLSKEFPEYNTYAGRTKRLVPFIW